jgi:hypothetical protein
MVANFQMLPVRRRENFQPTSELIIGIRGIVDFPLMKSVDVWVSNHSTREWSQECLHQPRREAGQITTNCEDRRLQYMATRDQFNQQHLWIWSGEEH